MKKIGILTHYYKNQNYGGVLQAFALCKFLNDNNYDAEQICYKKTIINKAYEDSILSKIKNHIPELPEIVYERLICKLKKKNFEKGIQLRSRAFADFSKDMIPHSDEVYTLDTISTTNGKYQSFITGSDQVWNGYDYAYWLDFVKTGNKISYAASISRDKLNARLQKKIYESLKGYKAISVRENNDKKLISSLTKMDIFTAIDPVFLLEKKDWLNISSHRLVKEKYILCYFLGGSKKERQLAKCLSKKTGYKLVTIPGYITDICYKQGVDNCLQATPNDFLSYIKDAEYVLTDSFHAVAFSLIFEKSFFVFYRDRMRAMSSRIVNITNISGTRDRFCNVKEMETIDYILNVKEIDYQIANRNLEQRIAESKQFLFDALEDCR